MDPTNPRILYTSFWRVLRTPYSLESGGEGSSLWKSVDGGDNWVELSANEGLPEGTIGISGIAVSPTNNKNIYAIIEAEEATLPMPRIDPQTPLEPLIAIAERFEVEVPSHAIPGKLVEELWEHFVKGGLERPTFVMDFPLDTSPLVREHRSIPGVVEKWDLYVRGFELATGYSELVDPVIQRERFTEQAKLAAQGDVEAMRIDEEFLRALEHGMPPSGGMGMGIDRLLMAITGLGIRETILFPLVK